MQCEAHEGLVQNIDRVHKSIGQLYDLDREKTDKLSSVQVTLAEIKSQNTAGFSQLAHWQEEFERQSASREARLERMINGTSKRRWTPQFIVGLVAAVLGPSGVAAIITLVRG